MSTGSIKHNIEITDSADAERFVEALEKAKSESEEGMERLTVEEVRQIKTEWDSPYMGKPNDFWENRIKGLFDTIEAQQQEIDQLGELHRMAEENCERLITDKDEQAGRIMKLDNGLKRLKLSLQWLYEINTNRWYKEWAKEKIAEIDALLGGKEDV